MNFNYVIINNYAIIIINSIFFKLQTDYLNNVLAVSGTEGIEIWRPRSRIQCA